VSPGSYAAARRNGTGKVVVDWAGLGIYWIGLNVSDYSLVPIILHLREGLLAVCDLGFHSHRTRPELFLVQPLDFF
jgi:hypothetical protein